MTAILPFIKSHKPKPFKATAAWHLFNFTWLPIPSVNHLSVNMTIKYNKKDLFLLDNKLFNISAAPLARLWNQSFNCITYNCHSKNRKIVNYTVKHKYAFKNVKVYNSQCTVSSLCTKLSVHSKLIILLHYIKSVCTKHSTEYKNQG